MTLRALGKSTSTFGPLRICSERHAPIMVRTDCPLCAALIHIEQARAVIHGECHDCKRRAKVLLALEDRTP